MNNRISHYRKQAKMSQAKLAELINKSQGAIGNYESGIRNIDLDTCWSIVKALRSAGCECTFADVFPEPKAA